MVNYFSIIKNALKITLKNKYLWWFGFLISLSSLRGNGNFSSGKSEEISEAQFEKMLNFFMENHTWIIFVFIIALVILITLAILRLISRGALIDSIEKNIKNENTTFRSGFKEGKKNFWKLFAISFSLGIFVFLTITILSTPIVFLFVNKNYFIGGFLAFLAILIFVPLMILVAYMKVYGQIYAVTGKISFKESLENAYNLFLKNVGSSLIMGLILCLINFVIIIILFLMAIPLFVTLLGVGFLLHLIGGNVIIMILIGIVVAILLPIMFLIRSIFTVFTQTSWILFFQKIATPEAKEGAKKSEVQKEKVEDLPEAAPVIESK